MEQQQHDRIGTYHMTLWREHQERVRRLWSGRAPEPEIEAPAILAPVPEEVPVKNVEPVLPTERIIRSVCSAFSVSKESLLEHRRNNSALIEARLVCVYLLRNRPHRPLSTLSIGRAMQRDHSTILHSLRKIERLRDSEEFMQAVNSVLQLLSPGINVNGETAVPERDHC